MRQAPPLVVKRLLRADDVDDFDPEVTPPPPRPLSAECDRDRRGGSSTSVVGGSREGCLGRWWERDLCSVAATVGGSGGGDGSGRCRSRRTGAGGRDGGCERGEP